MVTTVTEMRSQYNDLDSKINSLRSNRTQEDKKGDFAQNGVLGSVYAVVAPGVLGTQTVSEIDSQIRALQNEQRSIQTSMFELQQTLEAPKTKGNDKEKNKSVNPFSFSIAS